MRFFSLLILLAFLASLLPAQVKPIHFKVLQESLPTKTFKGFERKKPTGRSQTAMGMSTSEAAVEYQQIIKEGEEPVSQITVTIKIQDMIAMPYAMMAFTTMQDYENETEDGYEKSVLVLEKYRGMENARTGEYKSLTLNFGVAGRFLVDVQLEHSDDAKFLGEIIAALDLAKLEKAAAGAK